MYARTVGKITVIVPAMGQIVRRIRAQVVALLFWSAIILPVLYLFLLIMQVDSGEMLVIFLALVGLHLIALIGGHPHRRTIDS